MTQHTATIIPFPARGNVSETRESARRACAGNLRTADPGRAPRRTTFLLVPGLFDSDENHWQTRWQQRYGLPRVVQPDWRTPDIDAWGRTLEEHVRRHPEPVVVIAHSFGCLATAFVAPRLAHLIRGALLVAPADPGRFDISARLPLRGLPFPSMLVGSRNDPWMEEDWARWWARRWRSRYIDLGDAGHINSRSGFGDWPFGWRLAQRLARMR